MIIADKLHATFLRVTGRIKGLWLNSSESCVKSTKKKGLRLSTVKRLWAEINERVFDSQLTEPCIRITRSRLYYGKCTVVDPRSNPKLAIYVSGPLHAGDSGNRILRDTLCHECIHQWQYQANLRYNDNHDETFTQWLPVIQEKFQVTLENTWSE